MPKNKLKKRFFEKSLGSLNDTLDQAANAAKISESMGVLQGLDPRMKICGAAVLILGAIGTWHLWVTVGIFFLSLLLIAMSRISFRIFLKQVWSSVLIFTGLIALPAVFTTPGTSVAHLPLLQWSMTSQGILAAIRLLMRAETAATIALLLVLTTPWTHLLKALRVFHFPVMLVTILGMTHRYLFLLIHLARDLFEARASRQVGILSGSQQREMTVSIVTTLMSRSLQLSEEIFLAMQSRGFSGEIYLLDDFRFKKGDWLAIGILLVLAALLIVWR